MWTTVSPNLKPRSQTQFTYQCNFITQPRPNESQSRAPNRRRTWTCPVVDRSQLSRTRTTADRYRFVLPVGRRSVVVTRIHLWRRSLQIWGGCSASDDDDDPALPLSRCLIEMSSRCLLRKVAFYPRPCGRVGKRVGYHRGSGGRVFSYES